MKVCKAERQQRASSFDSGSKMSGRSKCTAGGDEESTKRVQLHAITRQSQACCAHKPHTHIKGVTFEPHPQCLLSGPFSCIYHVKELNSIQLNRLQRCHCGVTHSDQL